MRFFKGFLLSAFILCPSLCIGQTSSYSLSDPSNYKHLAANATTTVKSGAGVLRGICINTAGASSNTLTVYDNTVGSGTVIAVIDTTKGPACFNYSAGFFTGLTVVIATGTAGDITVSYR